MKAQDQTPIPPRWATRLLAFFCAPHLLEEVQGDLEEEFHYQVKQAGLRHARFDYVRHVFGFMRPFAVRRKKQSISSPSPLFRMSMYRHFLLVALRNIGRQKAFSFINVAGLSLGMTCCLFIFLWIHDELSVDNFHPEGDQLYVVYQTVHTGGAVSGAYNSPMRYDSLGLVLPLEDVRTAVPSVTHMAFYATGYELPWGHAETFAYGDKQFKLEGSRASADFFTMFHYPLLAGDASTALVDISSIAISRGMAAKFFGTPEQALGKSLRYENRLDLTVTAVFEDVPAHSSLHFDFLINWASQMKRLEWSSNNMLTLVKLAPGADVGAVEQNINTFLQSRLPKDEPFKVALGLQPFHDMYRMANFVNGKPGGGRIEYIRIFGGVALFVLLIACINFMNLSTARSVKRAKEVGVRKVAGSSRATLIWQFFGESVVLSFFALMLSLLLVALLLPAFNLFTDKQIILPLGNPRAWSVLVALVLFTGLVAGSYPALFLSSLRPASILKGVMRFTTGALWFRRGLAVFQFVISIVLLIVTIVISRQTDYVQQAHLGYDRENLIYIRIEGDLSNPRGYATFKAEAQRMPGIALVDRSSEAPHAMNFVVDERDGYSETGDVDNDAIKWEGKEQGASAGFKPMSVGYDFVRIMNLQMADGRDFSRNNGTDTSAFLVNEAAVRQMNLKDPIGKWVSAWKKKGHIIGILKDYHTHSFREPIKPLIVDVKEYEYFGVIIVRTEPGQTKTALASLEQVYKTVNPNIPFAYQFLDQEYGKLYHTEAVIARLSNAFAVVAILISCLGLLGLVMFSAEQRAKEFGIRKVMGATVANIMSLLSKDFLRLVLLSFCIAVPLAGYCMHRWLQGFAFHIALSWWIFVAAGAVALGVALVTICVQGLQSAIANPVRSLRQE